MFPSDRRDCTYLLCSETMELRVSLGRKSVRLGMRSARRTHTVSDLPAHLRGLILRLSEGTLRGQHLQAQLLYASRNFLVNSYPIPNQEGRVITALIVVQQLLPDMVADDRAFILYADPARPGPALARSAPAPSPAPAGLQVSSV